ncbi:probable 50S ribosomal protein L29, chloroplastic [Coccomyxa sp. Obi]|nr:probable 50S ribosomal protein L29, chloroplastic [Coccomyxa sp. Obi]
MAQRTKQPFKPSDFGYHQTKIAQLLTISREREIEQGISLRQARKTEKNKLVAAGFGGLYR